MAINILVQKLCREEEVGFVDLWGSVVGRADMYRRDGLSFKWKGGNSICGQTLSSSV